MIKLDKETITLAKEICNCYLSSNYNTTESIARLKSTENFTLTPQMVNNYIHYAIKYNLISDESAEKIFQKVIKSIDIKQKRSSRNTRLFYENLFKERQKDKMNFPNGHNVYENVFGQNKGNHGDQISLV